MISAFFTGVVVAIPTSLVMMKLLNSSLFINNSELRDMNQKISVIITQLDIKGCMAYGSALLHQE